MQRERAHHGSLSLCISKGEIRAAAHPQSLAGAASGYLDRLYRKKQQTRRPGGIRNKIVSDILSKLPYYDEFQIAFDARFQNWQTFYRHGFQQTSHYSYVTVPTENFLETLSYNMRRETCLLQAQY